MTLTRRATWLLAGLLVFSSAAWADAHEQAGKASAGDRSALVAGGIKVALADSSRKADDWAKLRPDYRELVPKKR
ncbi:MAG: hypothetical protein ACR2QB_02565 [Gammaproteobacteria bacterium]